MQDKFEPETNLESAPESEKILTPGEGVEKQQASEQISFILEKAASEKIPLTVFFKDSKGNQKKIVVIPSLFKDGILYATTESNDVIEINISQIKKVEQKEQQDGQVGEETILAENQEAPPEEAKEM